MARWINADTGALTDTATGAGITVAGTYYLDKGNMILGRPFALGAQTKTATHTATIQLFAEIAGAKTSIDSALTPVSGTPVAWPNEYTLTAKMGITVSGLTGTVYPEVSQ